LATELTIRSAVVRDAFDLAPRLRASDRREVEASHGYRPLEALQIALEESDVSFAAVDADGRVLLLFGVALLTEYDAGSPWMLAAEGFPFHRQGEFLRRSRWIVGTWIAFYHHLVNMVDARNTASIRWLRHLGAKIGDPVPYGVQQLPFYPFEFKGV
jgi:hypothetical protein